MALQTVNLITSLSVLNVSVFINLFFNLTPGVVSRVVTDEDFLRA